MEKFILKKSHLTENEINELLYYYKEGINIGKEETMTKLINNMIKCSLDLKTISKITNKKLTQIKQYLNYRTDLINLYTK